MTMLVLALVFIVIIVGLAGAVARIRSKQLDDQAICRDEFFTAVGRLVADPETPERTIDEMERLAGLLTSRTVLWGFVKRAITGQLRGTGSLRDEYLSTPLHLQHDQHAARFAGPTPNALQCANANE